MDRRSFIGGLLAVAAFTKVPFASGAKPKSSAKPPVKEPQGGGVSTKELMGQQLEDFSEFGQMRILYTSTNSDPTRSHFVSVNTKARKVEFAIELPIVHRHAIVLAPGREPAYAFFPELEGRKACLVDLKRQEVVASIEPDGKAHQFSGHACFSADGESIFVPEFFAEENAGPGVVVERRLPDLSVKRKIATGQFRPHNLILSSNGKKMLVGHYGRSRSPGEPPSEGGAVLIDLKTGKPTPAYNSENPYLAYCHLERDDDDNVFISTRSWAGYKQLMSPVLFGTLTGQEWESRLPEDLKDRFRFNFSLRYSPSTEVLGVAHLEGKMVSFWNPEKKKLLGITELSEKSPLGLEISPDGKYFILNTTDNGLVFIEAESRKLIRSSSLAGIGVCPHIAVLPVS